MNKESETYSKPTVSLVGLYDYVQSMILSFATSNLFVCGIFYHFVSQQAHAVFS